MAAFNRRALLLGGAAALMVPPCQPFAAGGVVTGPPSLVGEAGPEFIVPDFMAVYLAAIVASVAVNEVVREITTTVRVP